MAEVELSQFEVARFGDLQIHRRARDDGDSMARSLDDRGLVGANKAVCSGFGEGLLQQAVAKALRRLCQHHKFAGYGRGNQRTVRRTLDLLDGIDRRQTDDGRAVSITASMVRSMVVASIRGRTASCTSTISSGSAASEARA